MTRFTKVIIEGDVFYREETYGRFDPSAELLDVESFLYRMEQEVVDDEVYIDLETVEIALDNTPSTDRAVLREYIFYLRDQAGL